MPEPGTPDRTARNRSSSGPEAEHGRDRERGRSRRRSSKRGTSADDRTPAAAASGDGGRARGAILSSLQIETPLEEFRNHVRKKQRSFEGGATGRAAEIYKRAHELAEQLIRKQRGGDERC